MKIYPQTTSIPKVKISETLFEEVGITPFLKQGNQTSSSFQLSKYSQYNNLG